MKLRQIWETRNSLIKLFQSDDVPINLAWRLKPLAIQASEIQESYLSLMKKHGTQNDQAIAVPPENQAAFFEEFNALMDEDLAVDVRSIHPDELNGVGVKLSAIDLVNLDWLITEERAEA